MKTIIIESISGEGEVETTLFRRVSRMKHSTLVMFPNESLFLC